jgi:tetratricopeptide (TPR) repeat protein
MAQAAAIKPLERFPWSGRLANALVSYSGYLAQTLWPSRLAVLYPYCKDVPARDVAASAALLAGMTAAAAVFRRRYPFVLVGWLWYLGMLVPVIGLVQVGDQARADRYTYLPLIGPSLALVWGAAELAGRSPLRIRLCAVASVLALAALIAAAWRQANYWRDGESLWTRALACTSDNFLAYNNRGSLLLKNGRTDEAVADFRSALAIRSDLALAHNNLGLALAARGEPRAAICEYENALAIDRDYVDAHFNLAEALSKQGDPAGALAHYTRAVETRPGYAEAHNRLALALAGRRQLDAAVEHFRKAVDLRSDDAEFHCNLGWALFLQGKFDEAIAELQKALEIDPEFAYASQNLALVKQARARINRSNGAVPFAPPRK